MIEIRLSEWRGLLGALLALAQIACVSGAIGKGEFLKFRFDGLKSVSEDTNAPVLSQVLEFDESISFRRNLADKLAVKAVDALAEIEDGEAHPRPNLLRPLINDLFMSESFGKIDVEKGVIESFTLAVHIDGERAGMWSRHLRRFFEGMYSDATVTSRDNLHWRLESESKLKHVIFKHKNGWCIIVGGVKAEKGLCSILEQIKETRDCGASGWCQLFVDMSSAPSCLKIPDYLEDTRIRLTMENRNGAVRSKIVLDYPAPIEVELEKWNIPENLVRDPLVGFTAVRGFRQCLARTDAIRDIGLTNPPSQAFFWSQGVNPFMLSYAFPTEDASGYLSHIAERFRESPTEMMKNLGIGEFDWNPETRVLRWLGLPIIVPRLEVPGDANSKYIGGGLFPPLESTNPAPAELFKQVKGRSDLVYYDWEITQARLPQAHFLNFVYGLLNASRKHTAMQQGSQTMSKNTPENNAPEKRSGSDTKPDKRESVENKSALSTTKEARAASAPTSGPLFQAYSDWLKKTTPLLENTVTEVTIESPCRMELKRKSDIGLTSFELAILGNLLSDRNRNIPGPTAIPQPGIRNEGPGDGE